MKIICIPVGAIEANCYLVTAGDAALVIDPGDRTPALEQAILPLASKIRYILLTHRHADHLMAAAWLKDLTHAETVIHPDDAAGLSDPSVSLSAAMQVFSHTQSPIEADRLVGEGDTLACGDMQIAVLHTPGHSAGGVCYKINHGGQTALFTGDTLFAGAVGRTDLPSGNYAALLRSVARLAALPGDCSVYPGHGPATTLERERRQNPYMRERGL